MSEAVGVVRQVRGALEVLRSALGDLEPRTLAEATGAISIAA